MVTDYGRGNMHCFKANPPLFRARFGRCVREPDRSGTVQRWKATQCYDRHRFASIRVAAEWCDAVRLGAGAAPQSRLESCGTYLFRNFLKTVFWSGLPKLPCWLLARERCWWRLWGICGRRAFPAGLSCANLLSLVKWVYVRLARTAELRDRLWAIERWCSAPGVPRSSPPLTPAEAV